MSKTEIGIVVCIIGLLAAMAFPAFARVRETQRMQELNARKQVQTVHAITEPKVATANSQEYGLQVLTINNRAYFVFPKPIYGYETFTIDGKTMILIPVK